MEQEFSCIPFHQKTLTIMKYLNGKENEKERKEKKRKIFRNM